MLRGHFGDGDALASAGLGTQLCGPKSGNRVEEPAEAHIRGDGAESRVAERGDGDLFVEAGWDGQGWDCGGDV